MQYHKENPYLASIKHKSLLNDPKSDKEVYHFVLDVPSSKITYDVGDSIGIFPSNNPSFVKEILAVLQADGNEQISCKKSQKNFSLSNYLTYRANLCDVNKSLIQAILEKTDCFELKKLLLPENRPALKEFTAKHQVWDFLKKYGSKTLLPQTFVECLRPMMPRFYSIASSAYSAPNEIHLTVGMIAYQSNGEQRYGTATYFLEKLAPLSRPVVPIYLQPNSHFSLPSDPKAPIIMVGPGTGIAPFRGFVQERLAKQAPGKNWLFFGDRHRSYDFLYKEYFLDLENQGKLRLDLAFSRDQEEKIYVQHKMKAQAKELWSWLQQGAYFYVCGDAKKMAKDVDTALLDIAQSEGTMSKEDAKTFVKKLRADKRYQRDVY